MCVYWTEGFQSIQTILAHWWRSFTLSSSTEVLRVYYLLVIGYTTLNLPNCAYHRSSEETGSWKALSLCVIITLAKRNSVFLWTTLYIYSNHVSENAPKHTEHYQWLQIPMAADKLSSMTSCLKSKKLRSTLLSKHIVKRDTRRKPPG